MANCDFEVALVSGPLGLTSPEITLGAGAIVEFFGNVRPLENGEQIDGIEYEAHPEMAGHQLRKIAHEAVVRFDLLAIPLRHSVGFVAVGDTSWFLRAAGVHRGAAFGASRGGVAVGEVRAPRGHTGKGR